MKRYLDYANLFIKQSDWKDLALIKLCVCAAGIILGVALPKKAHKPAALIAVAVFMMTYVPIILKLIHIMDEHKSKNL